MVPNFISTGDEFQLILPLVVTADERLQKILRAQKLGALIYRANHDPKPMIDIDYEFLKQFTPKNYDFAFLQGRLANRIVPDNCTDRVDIDALIERLETEVRRRFG
jgi:hypothetical protein